MVFSSLTFLYGFLPLVVISYFICKNRVYRNSVLLVGSILFYSWGEPKLIGLMLLASLVAYIAGLLMDKYEKDSKPKLKKLVFIVSVVLLTANLFVFKYLNFAADNIGALFGVDFNLKTIALPIGISFYTFQILSYVIDLFLGKVKVQKNWFYLTLYVTFFPQLIAGPIVRYETVEEEIRERKESTEEFSLGLQRFIRGLAKKVIIANNVAIIPTIVYAGNAQTYGSAMYWLAALGYALQIYFDFSGYSDMAIGLGRMFGFHFLENFNYPYIATSVTDFWRRWHISLSSWFRDYIYIPLGGNRVKKARFVFNILVVWCLTGFWHGAEWNFIIWGLYYGLLLLCEKLLWGKYLENLPKVIRWVYSMFFVLIGWVIFNMTDVAAIGKAMQVMFSFMPTDLAGVITADTDILRALIYVPLGVICMLPWKNKVKLPDNAPTQAVVMVLHIALLAVSVIYTISSSYNPFIYFRF